jgi:ATP-dependent exoDNAse (exonuclease V) alpha subunit
MDDLYGILSPSRAQQLPALHAQRRRLIGLIADINDVKHRLVSLDPSEFWSSRAQRAYSGRVEEIVHEVQAVLDYLTEAQEQIWLSIRQLQAADVK